jgi:hypothetical protein
MLLVLVVAFSCAMRAVLLLADFKTTFGIFFLLWLAFFVLIVLMPDRLRKVPRSSLRLFGRERLELFLALLDSARDIEAGAGERIRMAVATWLAGDTVAMSLLLPSRRSLWMLSPLLTFVRLARAVDAVEVLDVSAEPSPLLWTASSMTGSERRFRRATFAVLLDARRGDHR